MKASTLCLALACAISTAAWADVSLRDTDGFSKRGTPKAGDKNRASAPGPNGGTGAIALTDNSGFQFFFNSAITFATTSSASGAASEASYVAPVLADTSGGGTVSSTLNDAFDGYNSVCISVGVAGQCTTSGGTRGSNGVFYNNNGAATADASCTETPAGGTAAPRLFVYNPQVMALGGTNLSVRREVYVPANDSFARWTTLVTNTGATTVTVNVVSHNNLGSDSNTVVVSSSDGDAIAETTDSWVTSFQNFSGTTSSDPRLGHVVRGNTAPPLNLMQFVNGDDNPIWSFPITLAPGQTRSVMYFATGQATRAAAATKATALASLASPSALNCMSPAERAQVANFAIAGQAVAIPLPTGNNLSWLLLGGGLLVSGLWFGRGRLFGR